MSVCSKDPFAGHSLHVNKLTRIPRFREDTNPHRKFQAIYKCIAGKAAAGLQHTRNYI